MFHFKTKQFFLLFAVLMVTAHPALAWDDEEHDDDRSSRYETPDDIQNRYHSRHTENDDRETPIYERAKILRDTRNQIDHHEASGSSWRRQVMDDNLKPAYEEEDIYIRHFPED